MCVYLYGFHITRSISHTALLLVLFFCEQNILRADRPAQTGTLQRRLHARQKKKKKENCVRTPLDGKAEVLQLTRDQPRRSESSWLI